MEWLNLVVVNTRRDPSLTSLYFHRSNAGLTLSEFLVTITVTTALTFASIPMFKTFILDRRISVAANGLYTDLFLARTEAIKRWQFVIVCRSRDGSTCTNGSWSSGWIVFADANENNQRELTEPLLRVQQRLPVTTAVRFSALATDYVRYRPSGSGWPNGTFTFCDARGSARSKAVIFFQSGRPRIAQTRSNGKPLDCSWFTGDT